MDQVVQKLFIKPSFQRFIIIMVCSLLPLPSLALHRLIQCVDQRLHTYLGCNTKSKLLPPKKRAQFLAKCTSETRKMIDHCVAAATKESMLEDCALVATPYPLGPKVKKVNPKYAACYTHFIEEFQKFRTTMHRGSPRQRASRFKSWSAVHIPALVKCSDKYQKNVVWYSPPLTRPAFLHKSMWTYPTPLPAGTKGYLCVGAHSGVAPQWVSTRIKSVKGNNIVVSYRGRRRQVTWGRFLPRNKNQVKLRYPTSKQLSEKSVKDRIGKLVAEYITARAIGDRDSKPIDFKPSHFDIISHVMASRKKLVFNLDLSSSHAGKGRIELLPMLEDRINMSTFQDPDVNPLWRYFPEKMECKVIGNLSKSYLPEVCQ